MRKAKTFYYRTKNFTLLTSSRGKLSFILSATCTQTLMRILVCQRQTFVTHRDPEPTIFRFSKRFLLGRPIHFKKIAVLKKKKKF